METTEAVLWEGSPSQWLNLKTYFWGGLFIWLFVPVIPMANAWYRTMTTRYSVTTERVRVVRGGLSKRTEELELYRVRDITLKEPFPLNQFGLGTIELRTTELGSGTVRLEAVPNASPLREQIRRNVERLRAGRVQTIEHA